MRDGHDHSVAASAGVPDGDRRTDVARPPGRRKVPALAVAAALVAALLLGMQLLGRASDGGSAAGRLAQPVTEYPPTQRGAPVDLSGQDLAGKHVELAAFRGAPVVLNIWGSWCGPCRTEAPVLKAASTRYAGRGVQFLGVNVKDSPAAALAFERSFGITYPSLNDAGGTVSLALARYVPASVVPATLVLDRAGRVAARVLGAVEASTLRALLETVIAEA